MFLSNLLKLIKGWFLYYHCSRQLPNTSQQQATNAELEAEIQFLTLRFYSHCKVTGAG